MLLIKTLRRRLERSDVLTRMLGGIVAAYAWICYRTIRWKWHGYEDLKSALAEGPVVLLVWHSRLMLCAPHLRVVPRFYTIHDEKPAGRLAGASQRYFGMRPIEMSTKGSNQTANREILKALKTGASVGLTVDGPRGPARVVKQAPLDWARISGAPVFLYAFSCTRQWRANSWDRLLVPRPFGRGCASVRRWDGAVPRRASEDEMAALRDRIGAALDAHQAEVDAAIGLPPGP